MFSENNKKLEEPGTKERSKTRKTRTAGSRRKLNAADFTAMVKERAYEIYLDRVQTNQRGDDFSDWMQAEKELRKNARRKM